MSGRQADKCKIALQTGAYVSQCFQLRDLDKDLLSDVLGRISDNLNTLGAAVDVKLIETLNSSENPDDDLQNARLIHWQIRNAIEKSQGEVVRSWYDLSFILGISGRVGEAAKFRPAIIDAARMTGFPEGDLDNHIASMDGGDFASSYKEFMDAANRILETPVVFISHATKDRAAAEEIAGLLRKNGIRAFVASTDILLGQDWESRLKEELLRADEVLLIISENSTHSDWVMIEVGASWGLGKKLTPCMLSGVADIASLPEPIRRFQARSILTLEDREKVTAEVAQRLAEPAKGHLEDHGGILSAAA